MLIRREDVAAVAVDYQERLMPVMQEKEALLAHSVILLRGLKELGVPIYLTQQYTRGLGMTVPEIVEAAGTREYLEKISYSAAEEVILKLGGKKSVILCGIESHICVLQTVIDLKSRGFQPVLVTDCISSRKARDLKWRWNGRDWRALSLQPTKRFCLNCWEKQGQRRQERYRN